MTEAYTFDDAAATRAEKFFAQRLRHVEGARWAGKKFILEPWQRDEIVRPMFGWKRSDGTRQYRTAWVEVPRKNGKSLLGAGLGLYLTFADGEPGAKVFSAAADREQAAVVFNMARQMVQEDAKLAAASQVFRRSITVPRSMSAYYVISAEAYSKHGTNIHGCILDEVHVQQSRELFDVLKTAQGARTQPLMVMLTTAGVAGASIYNELHDYAANVKAGIVDDPSFLSVIYSTGVDEDWTDPAVWRKANPNLGVSISEEFLTEECERAKQIPAYQNTFRRLYLNQITQQDVRWLDLAKWDACAEPVLASSLLGRECYAGLDLASTTDITALVLCFPSPDGSIDVLPYFWVPADNATERERRDRVPYLGWAQEGHINLTSGNVMDYSVVEAKYDQLAQLYRIQEVAYDRWNASQLVQNLTASGANMVPFGQGFASMSSPTKELMTLVLSRKLRHGGHPVLRWMANNMVVEVDAAENVKPAKNKSVERIDGMVALIMGLDRTMRHEVQESIYESGESLWLD